MHSHRVGKFYWTVRIVLPPSIHAIDQFADPLVLRNDAERDVAFDRFQDPMGFEILAIQVSGHPTVDPALLQVDAVPNVTTRADPILPFTQKSERP
ncbi:MAG: hypothetical protein Q8M88_15235 [Phenylobacterium sp.]|nr:hypothetical protein [Phenylobacterium sp.]MDP3175783.1 hypothetical protein [Phenylobacterium sp.]